REPSRWRLWPVLGSAFPKRLICRGGMGGRNRGFSANRSPQGGNLEMSCRSHERGKSFRRPYASGEQPAEGADYGRSTKPRFACRFLYCCRKDEPAIGSGSPAFAKMIELT